MDPILHIFIIIQGKKIIFPIEVIWGFKMAQGSTVSPKSLIHQHPAGQGEKDLRHREMRGSTFKPDAAPASM